MYTSSDLIILPNQIKKAGYLVICEGKNLIVTCKESAKTYKLKGEIAYKILPTDSIETALANFKKLEGFYGLDTDVKVVKHEAGDFLVLIDSWYNKNFFTEELGRILISYCKSNFDSLEHFMEECRFKSTPLSYSWPNEEMKLKRYYAFFKDAVKIINSLTDKEIFDKQSHSGIIASLFSGMLDDKMTL